MRTQLTPTGLYNHAWFALTDAEACRLLCCSLTRRGKYHIDEYDAMKNTLPGQEHARPMTNAGATHNVEDNERRFAGEIVVWLRKRTEQYAIDRLVIFAPPRMLGVLRMIPLGSMKGHVEQLKGDLMRLRAGQLADHPMVRELVTPHPSTERTALEVAAATGKSEYGTLEAAVGSVRGYTGIHNSDGLGRQPGGGSVAEPFDCQRPPNGVVRAVASTQISRMNRVLGGERP